MTTAEDQHSLLLVDEGGRLLHASGVFAVPGIASAVIQRWRRDAGKGDRRMIALKAGGLDLSVVAIATSGGAVFIADVGAHKDPLFSFVATVPFAADILRYLLTNPYQALTVVDVEGTVRYLSPVHERFFGLAEGEGVGRPVTEVIENTHLHEVARTGKAEIGQAQEMRGLTRIVSRVPVHNTEGTVVGAIGQIMFSGPEQLQALSAELGRLRSEVDFYRRELSSLRNKATGLDAIIGNSGCIRRLKEDILKIAPLDVPVLLVGESGTGKELVAHAIHLLSQRRDKSMVLVNAAALPPTLVETELFGYEPGAFTGAERKGRKGKFDQADQSSLFFDELGDMPLEIQVKLLRVLQDGMFERVGSDRSRGSNFRLISASNRDFQAMIADGSFRLDLYYRVSAITLRIPSLRERLDDIPLIVDNSLQQFAARHGLKPKRLQPAAVDYLQRQAWPGNVRQLIHAVERAAIFADGDVIDVGNFQLDLAPSRAPDMPVPRATEAAEAPRGSVRAAVSDLEGTLIREAMTRFQGNKKRVADELGISRSYLYKRLADLKDEGRNSAL
ncbi:MAG: sigma 54-interacting transcriptional regulator [Pseudomonadota bacterium]